MFIKILGFVLKNKYVYSVLLVTLLLCSTNVWTFLKARTHYKKEINKQQEEIVSLSDTIKRQAEQIANMNKSSEKIRIIYKDKIIKDRDFCDKLLQQQVDKQKETPHENTTDNPIVNDLTRLLSQ